MEKRHKSVSVWMDLISPKALGFTSKFCLSSHIFSETEQRRRRRGPVGGKGGRDGEGGKKEDSHTCAWLGVCLRVDAHPYRKAHERVHARTHTQALQQH